MDNEQSIIAIVGASVGIVMLVRAASPDPSTVYHGQVPGTSDPFLASRLSAQWNMSKSGGAYFRIAFGGALVIVVLLIVAKSQPRFAESVAWLVLIGTVFSYGNLLLPLLKKWTSTDPKVQRSSDVTAVIPAVPDPNYSHTPPIQAIPDPNYSYGVPPVPTVPNHY